MKKFYHWLWLALSILMVGAGVFAIMSPTATLVSLAWLVGCIMLLEGCTSIAVFATGHKFIRGAGWILLDGIVTVLLSVFLLWNNLFTAAALPYMFGMWIIMSGVQRAIYSFELKDLGIKGWGWLLAFGIASAILGVVSFMDPVVGTIAISVLVGWLLITYGVSAIVLWANVQKVRTFAGGIKRSVKEAVKELESLE